MNWRVLYKEILLDVFFHTRHTRFSEQSGLFLLSSVSSGSSTYEVPLNTISWPNVKYPSQIVRSTKHCKTARATAILRFVLFVNDNMFYYKSQINECLMNNSFRFAWENYYTLLASSTVCWWKTSMFGIVICPLDQWMNGMSNRRMECSIDISVEFASSGKYNTLWRMGLIYRMLVKDWSACHRNMSLGSNGSIGPSNVLWTFDLSSGFNGRIECPMDNSLWFAWGEILYLITYWPRLPHAGERLECLPSEYFHWIKWIHWTLECPLDIWLVRYIQWTNRMSNGRMEYPMDKSNVQLTFRLHLHGEKYNTLWLIGLVYRMREVFHWKSRPRCAFIFIRNLFFLFSRGFGSYF